MILSAKVTWMLFATIVSNMGYALIAPFLPLEFNDKGISAAAQGSIFAIYAVGVVVWSLIVVNLDMVSRKNKISCGLLLMGICFISFSAIDSMEN